MMSIKHYIFFLHFFLKIIIKYNGDIMSKESFKSFARIHPELATSVLENKISWQQLYELYEIYGENNEIWNNYLITKTTNNTTFKDVFDTIRKIDLNTFQEGINNIQKTIGLIQSIGLSNNKYEPKPLYKRFDER